MSSQDATLYYYKAAFLSIKVNVNYVNTLLMGSVAFSVLVSLSFLTFYTLKNGFHICGVEVKS